MKYVNANEVLPEELLLAIKKYYQGGYLYISKENIYSEKKKTDYRIELEKRDQHIYLKHLEGRTNGHLAMIYHLSEPSIRRIILKEKVRYLEMKKIVEELSDLWEIETGEVVQIYPSAWEINHSYVMKMYYDKEQLERNIKISTILWNANIPVAKIIPAKTGKSYIEYKDMYFVLSKKLQGSNIICSKETKLSWKMGCAIARLHQAFLKCEKELVFWENSLLNEMKGWIYETLKSHDWQIAQEEEYLNTVIQLETLYDYLPKQLIHRDVHAGNFLFFEGEFSGYIDFDLSQKNVRIFDICYFLTGLLAEEAEDTLLQEEWLANVMSVVGGYESIEKLSEIEKSAIPCVMKCIELLFTAYFMSMEDMKRAKDSYQVFQFVQNFESEIVSVLC